MENKVELEIRGIDEKTLLSLNESLTPEIKTLPEPCRGEISVEGNTLRIFVSCSRIGLLRAVVNSIISTIDMLIELRKVAEGE
ncbi:MAG: CTAG/PCC1 family protein [Thermogladius sp.]|jgi:tRNA threonylcarbamoyladenosine modification (KEOPS) complex  Pcc1 subunit|nr:CTAG/PCC1 family protein [Thermogladius sp.]